MAVDTVARALALSAGNISGELSHKADLVNGVIPLSQIPPAAIERIVTVANDTARFALTTAEVQLGDTVKVVSTNKMYFVIDTDHLDGELGYQVYVAGKATEAVADQNGDIIDTTYVKAVQGKQLSTEDYTTAEKTRLSNCETVWKGSQAEYDALQSKTYDLYMIYEEEETVNVSESSGVNNISPMSDTMDFKGSFDTLDDTLNDTMEISNPGDETA